MKKFLLTVCVALLGLTASAQVYVGGEVGLWRDYDANKTSFSLIPEIGYKVSDSWALGVSLGYVHDYNNNVKSNGFTINPYARYSFVEFGPVSLFLDGGFGLSTYKVKVGDGKSSDARNCWEIGIKPGVKVSLAKNIDFVAHVGFLGYRDRDDESIISYGNSGFGFQLSGNDLNFGILYNF